MNVVKHLGTAAVTTAALLVIGCGKNAQDLTQTVQESGLMKTWSVGCNKSELLDVSAKAYYQFDGKDLKKVYELYQDDKCTTALVTVKQIGTFDLKGDDNRAQAGSKDIDMHFNRVTVQASSPAGQNLLEKVSFCDQHPWPTGQEIDVTGKLGSLKCPLPKAHDEFDIYHLDGNSLVFGEGKFLTGRAETADKRATKLASDVVYHPDNKKF